MNHRTAACLLLLILALDASNSTAQPPAAEPVGRRIYVPIEDLDAVLDHDQQGVLLPRAEFLKLHADAKKQLGDTQQSPHPVVISKATYAARTIDHQIVISAVIELNHLAHGWQTVSLPFSGLAVEGAILDDKPAEIGRASTEGRPLVAFIRQPGKHTLKLELSGALVNVGSDQVAGFGLPRISAATFQITVPAGKHLQVAEVPLERPSPDDQPAAYSIPVGGQSSLSLRFTDRRTKQESASLVFAGTAIGLYVAPEERTWRAATSLSVFGKPIDTLTFTVPKSLEIVSVESSGLERWEIGDGAEGNTTTLKLVYRQPFNETRSVTFSGVSASVLGQVWSVPTLSLASATSHLVRVLVQNPAALRLHEVEATGIRRVAADDVAASESPAAEVLVRAGAGQVLHYAAWRESFSLLFVTQPRARELQATIATRIDITGHELSLRASVVAQTRFAPLFDFDLALPVDWTVTDVLVENKPVAWRVIPVGAEVNQLRVSFNPPIPPGGKVNLNLAARMIPVENLPIEDQPLTFKLPEVTLPQVGVTDGRYMIAADDDLDLVPEDVSGLDPARLSATEQSAPGAPRLVYEYQDTHFAGTVRVTRKPVRVAAQTVAVHRLDRETLVSHIEARIVVQGGGLQKLQVALPESAGTNLRFSLLDPPNDPQVQVPRITEQTSAPHADGQRVWTLQLDQRAFGLVWLAVDLTAPRAADATTFVLPGLRVVSADRQNGFVAVEAAPEQQLEVVAVDAAGVALAEVDPADVPAPLGYAPRERIVAAYRAIRPGFRMALTETRYDRQAVPTAFCDKALLTSVIGEAGQQQHKAQFRLRLVGVQSLHVGLDGGSTLWATSVDGKPVEVRKEAPPKTGWIVPLPQGSHPDQPILVELFYRTSGEPLAAAGFSASGRLRQSPPQIHAIGGQGNEEPIEILTREWVVYHPAETEIIASTGQFEPVQKPSRASFLGALHQSLTTISPQGLWQKAIAAVVAGAVIFIVFFAYRRRGIVAATLTVVGGIFLAVIALVSTPQFSSQEHSASSYFSESTKLFSDAGNKDSEERYGKVAVNGSDVGPYQSGRGPARGLAMADKRPATTSGPVAGTPAAADPNKSVLEDQKAMGNQFRSVAPESKEESKPQDGEPATPGRVPTRRAFAREKKALNEFDKRTGALGAKDGRKQDNAFFGGGGGTPLRAGAGADPTSRGGINPGNVAQGGQFIDGQPAFDDVAGILPQVRARDEDGVAQDFNFNLGQAPFGKSSVKGALLSLAIDLPVPDNSRQTKFQFSGSPAPEAVPTLEVDYQNRRSVWFVSLAWQAGVLLVFWFARKWSAGVRAALGILGLVVPVAIVAVVPIDELPSLDGLFLGTVWGLVLWAGLAIVARVKLQKPARASEAFLPLALFALAFACGFANQSAVAQDPKPQAPASANPASAGTRKSLAPAIVIPYDPAQDPLQSTRVFLPWKEFLELWSAAHPDQAVESPAPVEGLVAEALYAVRILPPTAGKTPLAEVTARFVLHSFADEQATIALPLGRVAFDAAQLDGKAAPLVTRDIEGGSELAIVVPARGAHVLDAKFTIAYEQTGAAGKFTLTTKPVPAGSIRLTLPEGDLNLRVSGGAKTYRRLREDNRTIAVVPIDEGGQITIAWTPAQVREAAQGIVHVESTTALSLGDAGVRINGNFKYTVRQGAISDVSYSLPANVLVRQIAGLDLGGWEIAGEGADRTLKVFLRRPVNDATAVQFDLFVPQSFTEQAQPVALPPFAPVGVTREVGTVGIYAEKQLTVAAGAATGLAQIDAGQFATPAAIGAPGAAPGAPAAVPPLLAYRFAARPVQLQLNVARQKPQSKGTAEHAVVVGARKQRMASRFDLELAGAPRSEISIKLPPRYLLYDLKSNDIADHHIENREGEANPLLIAEFAGPRTGAVSLVLQGIVPRVPEDVVPQIAVPVPLEISELRTSLAVWLDRIYTGTLDDITGWKSIDPATLPQRLRSVQSVPVQFAFSSNITGLQPVILTLNRAVPRLSADSLSVVIARDTSVQHLLYLRWRIAAAGESTFVFTTPDWLADRLEFERGAGALRIRQVTTERIAGNRLRWIVTLDEPRTTVATLIAQAALPPPDAGRIEAPVPQFEQVTQGENGPQYQALDQQHQFVVLANQSPDRLEQLGPDAVEAIPAVDLPITISQVIRDQAAEILRVRDPRGAIGWSVQGAQAHKSSAASVNLAKMTLVIAHDGSWRGLAQYRINNRSRQFLALRMPAGSRILSLFVADRPARPIDPKRASEPNLALVPLPKTAEGDLSAEVKLVYAGRFGQPLPRGFQVLRSELELPAPQVLSQTEDAKFGIPVAATEWTVIVPRDVDAARIEDAARSNVVESVAGVEEQIALYNEWLNLMTIASSRSGGYAANTRAANNLKNIGLATHNFRNAPAKVWAGGGDDRQSRELAQLESKVQEAQQRWQAEESRLSAKDAAKVGKQAISNFDVQRELIMGNSADFSVNGKLDANGESDGDALFGLQTPADEKAGAPDASNPQGKSKIVAGKATAANRGELRRQTESQAVQLNREGQAGGEQGRGPGQAAANQRADADELLEQSQNAIMADGAVRFVKPGDSNNKWPRYGNIVGLLPSDSFAQSTAPPGGGAGMGGGAAPVVDTGYNYNGADVWKSSGGLSLTLEIPQEGNRLTFSKSGGDARLALGLRPRASLEGGLGLAWATVWLLVGLGLVAALGRADAARALVRKLPLIAIGVGLACYFLLPVATVGFLLFLAGALALGWQHRRAPDA